MYHKDKPGTLFEWKRNYEKLLIRRLSGAKFTIERPTSSAHGDYAVFMGMEMAEEVAENIKKELRTLSQKLKS